MDISSPSFVKEKANSEISGFVKGFDGRHKVGGLCQKGEVDIDESDGVACKGAYIGGHWEFMELVGL